MYAYIIFPETTFVHTHSLQHSIIRNEIKLNIYCRYPPSALCSNLLVDAHILTF